MEKLKWSLHEKFRRGVGNKDVLDGLVAMLRY